MQKGTEIVYIWINLAGPSLELKRGMGKLGGERIPVPGGSPLNILSSLTSSALSPFFNLQEDLQTDL